MMTKFRQEYYSKFSVEDIYQLITDVESYPYFLPWCGAARIVEESDEHIIADLVVNFKAFTELYRSKVMLYPASDEGIARVETTMISGPFKFLDNKWEIEPTDSGCKINFYISFEFKSIVLEKIMGIFFSKAAEKMVAAFIERANQLYGESSNQK
jgi:coenzyme Q-binding protein COQ10